MERSKRATVLMTLSNLHSIMLIIITVLYLAGMY